MAPDDRAITGARSRNELIRSTDKAALSSILAGSAGNLVEWYDWYVYSATSLYFAPVFFPAKDRTAELLRAAAVFAIGFIVRPLGAWLLGRYADRHGRKSGLTFSVLLMCAGSLLIAVLPSHRSIGVLAPITLVFARLLQGLSVGGEYGASATYLSEIAQHGRRGFWSSLQYVTLIAGQLTALGSLLLIQTIFGREALRDWAWRLPFVIGALLAILVFWLRRGLVETSSGHLDSTALRLFRKHPKEALVVIGLTAGGTLAFYAFTTYMQKFLVVTAGFSEDTATRITAGALLGFMLLQPIIGALSDRIGRRPVLIGFGVLGTLATYPILSALARTHDPWVAFALIETALFIVSGYTAINAVVKAELFPVEIRALGVALPYAIANTVFGGTAEYVALWFKKNGFEQGFAWYVTTMIALSLIVYIRMRDTRDHSKISN